MCFNATELSTHNLIHTINVPISEAGENDTNATSDNNENQQMALAPINTLSKLKVTIGNTIFIPTENGNENDTDNNDE